MSSIWCSNCHLRHFQDTRRLGSWSSALAAWRIVNTFHISRITSWQSHKTTLQRRPNGWVSLLPLRSSGLGTREQPPRSRSQRAKHSVRLLFAIPNAFLCPPSRNSVTFQEPPPPGWFELSPQNGLPSVITSEATNRSPRQISPVTRRHALSACSRVISTLLLHVCGVRGSWIWGPAVPGV
jgi:hypothetical protein